MTESVHFSSCGFNQLSRRVWRKSRLRITLHSHVDHTWTCCYIVARADNNTNSLALETHATCSSTSVNFQVCRAHLWGCSNPSKDADMKPTS